MSYRRANRDVAPRADETNHQLPVSNHKPRGVTCSLIYLFRTINPGSDIFPGLPVSNHKPGDIFLIYLFRTINPGCDIFPELPISNHKPRVRHPPRTTCLNHRPDLRHLPLIYLFRTINPGCDIYPELLIRTVNGTYHISPITDSHHKAGYDIFICACSHAKPTFRSDPMQPNSRERTCGQGPIDEHGRLRNSRT